MSRRRHVNRLAISLWNDSTAHEKRTTAILSLLYVENISVSWDEQGENVAKISEKEKRKQQTDCTKATLLHTKANKSSVRSMCSLSVHRLFLMKRNNKKKKL